jgi:hypothetical protein
LSAKKSLRSRLWMRRGSPATSALSLQAGGDCSNFTVKSIDSESNSARLEASWCRSNSMSHACLLLRPIASLISALRSATAASALLAAYSTAASCATGSEAEWYSSDPRRPATRAAGRRLPVAPPSAGVAMR